MLNTDTPDDDLIADDESIPIKPPFEFPYCIEPPRVDLKAPVDWAAIFGRHAPMLIEIGCGGGRTVISLAQQYPELNCVGCERAGEYFRMLQERAQRRAIPNLRVTRTDATILLERFIPDASVGQYHIYFPDPWPKKKHHRRRTLTDSFFAQIRRTLSSVDGTLYFATDHKEYYDEILPRVQKVLDVETRDTPWADAPLGRTNFEIKYIQQGRPIYRLVGRRRETHP